MKTPAYVPDTGYLVWLNFDPQKGREQAGHRPALVLSPLDYNSITGLFVVCPITTRIKGYPVDVPLPADSKITGAVLSDHVKNLDWRARRAEFADSVDRKGAVLEEVRSKLGALLGFDLT